MDAKFFRKAKKANRAVEITDNEAIIPAVKGAAEIRVPLPNRRPRTMEERTAALEKRKEEIATLEEEIEIERKALLALTSSFKTAGSGAAEVVVQNLKIRGLMEQRSTLAHPERWIEEKMGLTLKDVFESKRDTRKIGKNVAVFQVKRRVEPISSLYVDLGAAAAAAETAAANAEAAEAQKIMDAEAAAAEKTAKSIAASTAPVSAPLTAAQGAIIGQRRTIKFKKPTGPPV